MANLVQLMEHREEAALTGRQGGVSRGRVSRTGLSGKGKKWATN
jgi:hypothetical protein